MGIKGLTRFIRLDAERAPGRVLQDYKLHDSRLVIDGTNLFFLLWEKFGYTGEYGGDYDKFAQNCRLFIDLLFRACNIEPYFVFDGAIPVDRRKEDTVLERMQQKVDRVEELNRWGRGMIVPIMAKKTLIDVLSEMGVSHVMVESASDQEMAVLANKFNCPLMSCDSDFYVADLKAGYIPFDFRLMTDTDTQIDSGASFKYIPVKLYTRKAFAEHHNINPEVIPFLACILGNDYVKVDQFERFFRDTNLKLTEKQPAKFIEQGKKILHWLETHQDIETCLNTMLQYVDESDKEKYENQLRQSLDDYSHLEEFQGLDLEAYFTICNEAKTLGKTVNTEYLEKFLSKSNTAPVPPTGPPLPAWFRVALLQCRMESDLQDALRLRAVYTICQVEVLSERSTWTCSQSLREIMYAILHGEDSDVLIDEFNRVRKTIKVFKVRPANRTAGNLVLPSLSTISQQKREDMVELLFASLKLPMDALPGKTMSDFSRYLIALLTYWMRNSQPKVTFAHCTSVLMCVILLHARLFKNNANLANKHFPTDFLNALSSTTNLDTVLANTEMYFKKPQELRAHRKDNHVIHAFAQFKACLKDSLQLNELLMAPVDPPSASVMLNSSFAYNFYLHLRGKPDKRQFLTDLLGDGSALLDLFSCVERVVARFC